MPDPSEQEIKDFVVEHSNLWMAHDKQRHTELWKRFASNEIIFEDPVGSPPKLGWDQWSEMWDRFNEFTLDYHAERIYACGNEAAIAFYHKMNTGDEITEIRDIEIWKFDNGTVEVRCWWDYPDAGAHAATLKEYSTLGGH